MINHDNILHELKTLCREDMFVNDDWLLEFIEKTTKLLKNSLPCWIDFSEYYIYHLENETVHFQIVVVYQKNKSLTLEIEAIKADSVHVTIEEKTLTEQTIYLGH